MEGMHSQLAGGSQVEEAIAILQEVSAAIQRDTDSCLAMRNVTKLSTFEAQCPGLNKPRYHCQPAYWPAREPLCSRGGQKGKHGPAASPGGRRGPVLSISIRV